MNKFITGIILTVSLFSLVVKHGYAQVKSFDDFEMSYFSKTKEGGVFFTAFSRSDGRLGRVYIEAESDDKTSKSGSIVLDADKLESFRLSLLSAMAKYVEWSKVAKDNNVTELEKNIELKHSPTLDAAFSYGKWHIAYGVKLNYRFKIEDKQTLLIVSTGTLTSSSNNFIESKGLSLVFSDEKEIESLYSKLDRAKIEKLILDDTNKEDLFK